MSGGKVKGHTHRIIESPGFRVHSKHDLSGLRSRINEAKTRASLNINLPLTPMLDLMSILVIYLLMNFSATGEVFFISKESIRLPNAVHARPIESAALISITKDSVIFEVQNKDKDGNLSFEERDEELPQLRARLQQLRLIEQQIRPNEPFKGQVNIQADKDIPLGQIKRVMGALISEGWTGINFATENRGSPAPRGTASEEEE